MRFNRDQSGSVHEGDLTPMIDMTFQLIAFFMVLVNFSQSEQHERIVLPDSELAKPPEAPPEFPITLHLTREGTVILGGQELAIDAMKPYLDREADDAVRRGLKPGEVTVIIRAHKNAQTGKVQELMAKCQESGLETFALRVKEKL